LRMFCCSLFRRKRSYSTK